MDRLIRPPPVVGLALAAAAGGSVYLVHLPLPWALPLLILLFLPNPSSQGPSRVRFGVVMAALAGWCLCFAGDLQARDDCRWSLVDGERYMLEGWLAGIPVDGRGEFLPDPATGPPCHRPIRVILPGSESGAPPPGARQLLAGTWRANPSASPSYPLGAGHLRVDSVGGRPTRPGVGLGTISRRVGSWVQTRIADLFPASSGLVSALVWARKEGLSREVREDFARAGVAHLLAISGFHVGVVAGILLVLAAAVGISHRIRLPVATGGVWAYVLAIGSPDAAVRAGVLLSVLALGRSLRGPVSRQGALATAFLAFFCVVPGALARVGFQLSFAGAFGLAMGYRPILSRLTGVKGLRVPFLLAQGFAAGLAATLATLPLVAWHFGRISLVGIPVTLLLTPVIALAIPGVFMALLLSTVHLGLAAVLAGGVELLLALGVAVVRWVGSMPMASVWVSEGTVVWGTGLGLAAFGLAFLRARRLRPRYAGLAVAFGVFLGPPLATALGLGTMEIVMLDVGQGDAVLLRSPGGRWALVDAGPRTVSYDTGERVVLPYLRRRGVRFLDLLVLTHGDMDHVGGASAILDAVPAGRVVDPGRPTGTEAFLGALESAQRAQVPWSFLRAGDSLNLDGMALRVLAPTEEDSRSSDANDASLVLEVRYGRFSALLTGDAPTESEERFLERILSDGIQVLKVGHHGSATSTGPALLERIRPETALISVGRRNRFGHPSAPVLARLHRMGSEVLRTDRMGNVVVRVRRDGSYSLHVAAGRPAPSRNPDPPGGP